MVKKTLRPSQAKLDLIHSRPRRSGNVSRTSEVRTPRRDVWNAGVADHKLNMHTRKQTYAEIHARTNMETRVYRHTDIRTHRYTRNGGIHTDTQA